MKVAFVSYDMAHGASAGMYPPLHLCNLATSLRLAGLDVAVFDYSGSFSGLQHFFGGVRAYGPDVVGMTCYTPCLRRVHEHTQILRRHVPNAAMILGGPHCTVWPQWTLTRMPQFDYVMQGEADRSIVAFVEMVAGKRCEEDVPGLVYRRGESIVANDLDRIPNLDELPQVDRTFLDLYFSQQMYWDMSARGTLDMMISSRGCPYKCRFCFKVDSNYRFRSTDHVMAEFDVLAKRGIRAVHIQDDAFTANKRRCIEVADALIRGKYRFQIRVRSRVNSVDEELLRKLKKAGVEGIVYGFESGSQKMLDAMNKKTTVEMNRRAIDLTKKVGMACYGDILIGMPGETRETIAETTAFLLETKPIVGNVSCLYPLPGTAVYEEAKASGTLQGDWDIEGPNPWVKLPWTESATELRKESERMLKSIQTDPGTICYFLKHHLRNLRWQHVKYLARLVKERLVS